MRDCVTVINPNLTVPILAFRFVKFGQKKNANREMTPYVSVTAIKKKKPSDEH